MPAGRAICVLPWLIAALLTPVTAPAGPGDGTGEPAQPWYLQGGGYVHYEDSDDYEGPPYLVGIEYHVSPDWFAGVSLFNNSYGQFSQYAYLGKAFYPLDSVPGLRVKLSAGVVQGYRGEHHDALPIRWGESWGLGIVPAIGYQAGDFGFDVALLKESAVLFLVGRRF